MNSFLHLAKNLVIGLRCGWLRFPPLNPGYPGAASSVAVNVIGTNHINAADPSQPNIGQLMQDGLMWAVPKKRRTVEKRLKRRFGVPDYPDSCRVLRSRNDLVACERCGDHHEYYALCPTCYSVVRTETDRIKEAARAQLDALRPRDRPLAVQYQDDEASSGGDAQFTVTVDRPRPQWFARQLMVPESGSYAPPRHLVVDPKEMIPKKS